MIRGDFMSTNDKFRVVEAMLHNYKNTCAEIKILKRDLEILENDYKGVNAISYEEKSSPTNAFNSNVENEVIKRAEKIQRLKSDIRLKEIEIENIDDVIEALDDRAAYMIKEFYFNKRQLKIISSEIHLDENYSSAYKTSVIENLVNLIFVKERT